MKAAHFLIFSLACTWMLWGGSSPGDSSTVRVPKEVACRVRPILDAACEARKESEATAVGRSATQRVELRLAKLMAKKGTATDEALVVLLGYYIGEASGEDVLHAVTVRGRRMLPYLRKYRHRRTVIPGGEYPESLRAQPAVRELMFKDAVEAIEKGEVIGSD
jgi:hypothetical protein